MVKRIDRGLRGRRNLLLALALLAPLALGSVCEGTASNRPGSITQGPVDPRCTPIGGPFPSGLDLLPGTADRAVAMRFSPAGLLRFDLTSAPPVPDNAGPVSAVSADSDGDGLDDAFAFQQAGLCPDLNPNCLTWPKVGSVRAAFRDVVLVTASGYEEVMFLHADGGAPWTIQVTNPVDAGAHRAADHPLLPPAGASALRTAVSTLTCVYPPTPVDSAGAAIGPARPCDPTRTGFVTRFTAASTVVGDRLFVATSNLFSSSRATFHPGTVLIHRLEFDGAGRPIGVRPDPDTPVVFTTAFNPTGLTAHRTPTGRDVVLVTQTGAIDAGGALLGDSAIDVIDAATARLVATVPLGLAGAAFGDLAIDPGGRVALIGAESRRHLYAFDLSALDDPDLYVPRASPVTLDGLTPGFADARIFDASSPFVLPRRPDGPPDGLCASRTNVASNHDGALAYATDWCDGSISVVAIDWSLPLERPVSRGRFAVTRRLDLFAPKTPGNFGLAAAPSLPRTRPGVPGRDFDGPDLFFLVNEPEGQLCAARVEY